MKTVERNKPLTTIGARIRARREALGMEQAELARRLNLSQAAVSQWEKNVTTPYGKRQKDIARILQCEVSDLVDDADTGEALQESGTMDLSAGRPNAVHAPMPGRPDYEHKIKELGLAQGGKDGVFFFNGETVDYHARPPGLAHRMQVYCIRIQGESMSPVYEDGDLLFVDAARKPFPGRDALIELNQPSEGASYPAFIKRVVAINSEFVELKEFNPKERIFRIKRSEIKGLHLILKNNDMY